MTVFGLHRLLVAALMLFSLPATAAKTFVYCSEGSPSIFNPQLATDGSTFNSARNIYSRLVEFPAGSTKVAPSLAESWKFSKDGRQVTFQLRRGVKFHSTKWFEPTREFNADDVIFTFQRMMNKEHPFHQVNGGTYEYFLAMDMGKIIEKIEKMDDHTVRFVLSRQEAPFLANMAMDFASILSAEYAAQLQKKKKLEDMDWKPVGTGPFAFRKYQKDTLIRFRAHPDYFAGKAAIDQLIFAITPDANVRTQKLKAGECDLIAEPSFTDLPDLRQSGNIRVVEREGLNVGYMAMNVEKKPFDNVLVRRAIHHALNRKAYIEAIYLGQAMMAKNPIPPSMWSYNQGVTDYPYDIEKAKSLLKQAGFPKGFSTELWVLPVSRPYNPNGKKMGELIQADLAKIGIEVKLVQYDWPTYLAKSKAGEHKMIQLGWTGDNGDPDNFLNVLLSCEAAKVGANRARWCDSEFDQAVNAGRKLTDVKERTSLYLKAQERFKNQAPWVTLAHAKVFRAYSNQVQGFRIDPFGRDIFYGVDKTSEKK